MRRFMIYGSALSLVCTACTDGQAGRDSNTFSSVDAGDGDGDGSETAGDGDGVPGDGDGTPGDGDGAPGDGDGVPGDGDGTPGDGDGDGAPATCERFLHIYDFGGSNWQSQPLDEAWTGANAPPCTVEPSAIAYLEPWDQLLVWGADGQFYRRISGTWQPPEPIASRWAMLADVALDSVSYVPPINGALSCDLIFTATPTAYIYQVFEDGATSYDQAVPLMDEPPPGPAQSSVRRLWSLELADPAMLGDIDWWVMWSGWSDGKVYRANGNLEWMSWPAAQSPMFVGAPPSVDPANIEAAWGNYALNRGYLVGF